MSRQLIAGNWKMNGLTADARSLAQALQSGAGNGFGHADLLVCPPFTQISTVAGILTGTAITVGGQDCHMQAKGAHTGDISAPMLRDLGATHVILGHSERRQNHKEIDETVREKVLAARSACLIPIVCVGETEDQRSADGHEDVVGWQIKGSLPDGFADGEGVVAYEPVWAIGTGRTATEQDVAAMHAFIRAELVRQFGDAGHKTRILYGGSVNAKNAAGLLAVADVGGALVGGASLKAQDFFAIAAAASRG
ncbi:triose-phosphate isomerase [Lichenicola cladoniae]|uniref:Triosephosphate isomerase n=1 Tax=Lichenicola cladoniae TaxID=1484109 RepID=A0A6M8HPV6_9PROT|nr:triose-phosphate isomerase [Lichenicola cladoniae]NPD66498.1 triose-phosphate isomerase [Acetobacteraceae bacterium]QKE90281.1 triose-phosphate isomerase [Lichenicola cladoniae]